MKIPDPRVDALGYKACCAALYESDVLRYLLGDSMRPGGLSLTRELLQAADIGKGLCVLDVACGRGDSREAVEELGGYYYGVDLGARNLPRGGARVAAAEVESLPFTDAAFDAVLVQCAFCTFAAKDAAAAEMARVLKPGGRLLLADVTLDCDNLPGDLKSVFAAVACLADARPMKEYAAFAAGASLHVVERADRPDAARAFLRGIDAKLLMVRIAQVVKSADLGGLDVVEARRLLKLGVEMIERSELSYCYLIAEK